MGVVRTVYTYKRIVVYSVIAYYAHIHGFTPK